MNLLSVSLQGLINPKLKAKIISLAIAPQINVEYRLAKMIHVENTRLNPLINSVIQSHQISPTPSNIQRPSSECRTRKHPNGLTPHPIPKLRLPILNPKTFSQNTLHLRPRQARFIARPKAIDLRRKCADIKLQ